MSGVAVAPDGNVWTINRGPLPIQVYTPAGALVKSWGQGMFKNAHTVRFDREGSLWVIDTLSQTVRKFTQDGKVLMTIGTPDQAGEDATHLNQPNDVAFAPNGDIFISDGYGNDRVAVFDKSGKFLRTWGKLGTKPGEFSQPHSIAVDSRSRVYVADRNNARVQGFDAQGKQLANWTNLITPWYIAITPADEIYVVGSSPMLWSQKAATDRYLATPPKDQLIMKFSTDGRVQQLWTFAKGTDGQPGKRGEVNWIHAIAVAADGTLYTAEVESKWAQKFRVVQ
jgi:DNA-binding beta-propeller fold protein YncE